eukprot:Pompholyxophrys_punicea_v1_NODE_1065_length_993_cov_9.976546.p1 type:complete len:150 gc:universal NODE_1065_length_993_cov_9.976546:702-253(-)
MLLAGAEDQDRLVRIDRIDRAYISFRNLRGSPPYFEQKKRETLAMLRQLGSPTFFVTQSVRQTTWFAVLAQASGMTIGEVEALNDPQRVKMCRDLPVELSRHFNEIFRKYFLHVFLHPAGPFGGATDFAARVEFQNVATLHLHATIYGH